MSTDLSIIIISYNTHQVTQECLKTLFSFLEREPNIKVEVIVVDNASSDDSTEMLKTFQKKQDTRFASSARRARNKIQIKLIQNRENFGFGAANNQALKKAQGRYILFMNSDVIVKDVNFESLVAYLDNNPTVGALTIKILLPDGNIDPASHRGFPNVWRAATYYTGLEKLTHRAPYLPKYLGGYHLTHLDLETIHEIDSPSGAFYLTRKEILDKLKGFDTSYFMYGEDLDLSFRIKKLGYKIMYYPTQYVVHLKKVSGLKSGTTEVEQITKKHFYSAMKIFYNKHYGPKNPKLLNKTVHFFIDLKSRL